MELSVKYLELNARKIGNIAFGDCYYSHIFEVWQNLNNGNYYLRETYYAGDDDGFDTVKSITKEVAKGYMSSDDFYKEETRNRLINFIKTNFNTCRDYARQFFADDIMQAGEYLFNQI